MGDLSQAQGRAGEAAGLYQKGLELLGPSKQSEYPFMKESRAALYEKLAALYLAQRAPAQAKDCFLRFTEELTQLAEQTGSKQVLRRLAAGYSTLSNLHRAEKDPLRAGECAQKSMEILAPLYQQLQTVPLGRDLAAVEIQGAVALGELGQNRQAVALLDQALELCGQLYSRTSSDTDYNQAAAACYYAGLLANWDKSLRRERLSQASQLWGELARSDPGNKTYLQCLKAVQQQLKQLR